MWSLIYTGLATIAAIAVAGWLKPTSGQPATGEETTSGTPNDSLLSGVTLENVSLIAGIAASIATVYLLTRKGS